MSQTPQVNKAYVLIAISLNFTSVDNILSGTNLTEAMLIDKETIDVADAVKIVHNLNEYSHTANWRSIVGKYLGIATHGPVGYATISAPSIGRALVTFVEWYQVRSETYTANIVETDEYFELHILDTTGDDIFSAFFFEALMSALEDLIGLLIGHISKGETTLYFQIGTENAERLKDANYVSHLAFTSEVNKLVVPKALWYSPSPLYDKDSYEFNLRKCQQLMEQREMQGRIDLVVRNQIRQHFERAIVSGQAKVAPTMNEICHVLHLTERTLIRKLKEVNTAYKQILAQERRKYAEQLLANAQYTIFNIADILGYRESANFCRAFKAWYGQSPTNYRRNPNDKL